MKPARPLWAELAMELAGFSFIVISVALLWRNNLLLLAVAAVECLIGLCLWHDRLDLCFFAIIAVLGTAAEVVFVRFGVWQYANPTWLGVPAWFPVAFGTTGLIGVRLARTVTALCERR